MQDCAFRHWLDANAEAIDRGQCEPQLVLAQIAESQLLRVGVDPAQGGTGGQVTDAVEAIAAIAAAFPASEQATAYRVSRCETGGTFWPWAAEPGGHHFGIFQVDPSIWGAVPADIEGQARQAAGIVAAHGWSPWSCY